MSRKIHAIVEYPSDLDPTILTGSIQQEVARTMNSVGGGIHAVSAVPKMIGSCSRSDLRAGLAARTLWILGHVEDGAKQ